MFIDQKGKQIQTNASQQMNHNKYIQIIVYTLQHKQKTWLSPVDTDAWNVCLILKGNWLYPCFLVLEGGVPPRSPSVPLLAGRAAFKLSIYYTWNHSQRGEPPSGRSPVLSFRQNPSSDVVIRWNHGPVGCILLVFSIMAKFLITVFMVAELAESFHTDLFQRCYVWDWRLNIATEQSSCLLLPYLN